MDDSQATPKKCPPGMYYLEGTTPVQADDIAQWAELYGADRTVALDRISGVDISTVFLGIDHSFGLPGVVPQLFQTMIFGGKHDEYMQRYATWAEAVEGHKIACDMITQGKTKRCLQFLKESVIKRAREYADSYGGTQKAAIELALKSVTPKQLMTIRLDQRVPKGERDIQARITPESRELLLKLQQETGQKRHDIVFRAIELLRAKWEISK